jgi:hypothetical protein
MKFPDYSTLKAKIKSLKAPENAGIKIYVNASLIKIE